jgi:8-oxo-dGTP pyrophosphatase MutT (NUDIX family)
VLVPLVQRDDGLHVLLTAAPTTCATTPGRSAFPAAAPNPTTADAVATALREAEEEVGLARRASR